MTDYLGVKRLCEGCEFGKRKWKSVYCANPQSNFNGIKTNSIVCAPCFKPMEKRSDEA